MTHHRYRVLLLILCCPLLWSTPVGAVIPPALKTSTPLTSSGTTTIDTAVKGEVTKLFDNLVTPPQPPDPAKQTTADAARKALIDEADSAAVGNAVPDATAAYQKAYAESVLKALKPTLEDHDPKNRLNRLNAAIILGGVAAKVSRTQSADVLGNIAMTMLKDKDKWIVFWGMKIARYALANDVLKGTKTSLPRAIVDAVKANEKSSEIVEQAYLALVLDSIKTDPGFGNGLKNVTIAPLMELVIWRTSLYQNGAMPVATDAESDPANTLVIYGANTIAADTGMKKGVVKALGELLSAQLGVMIAGAGDPVLNDAAKRLGDAMAGIGPKLGEKPLADAGLLISKLGSNPQVASVTKAKADLDAAVAAIVAAP